MKEGPNLKFVVKLIKHIILLFSCLPISHAIYNCSERVSQTMGNIFPFYSEFLHLTHTGIQITDRQLATSTEWDIDALTIQATTAGFLAG